MLSWKSLLAVSMPFTLVVLSGTLLGYYDFFIDEYYYFSAVKNLDFGYVDKPPLAVWILSIILSLFGDSVWAVRLLPALSSIGVTYLTALIARDLGLDKKHQVIAALAANLAFPVMVFYAFYSTNIFEILFFLSGVAVLFRVSSNEKLWLLYGLIAGLATFNKHSAGILFLILSSVFVAYNFRASLKSKYFYLGGLLASLVFMPNILWMYNNDWVSFEFYRNHIASKSNYLGIGESLWLYFWFLNPGFALFFIGTAATLKSLRGKSRGWIWVTGLGIFGFFVLSGIERVDRVAALLPLLGIFATLGWYKLSVKIKNISAYALMVPVLTFALMAPAFFAVLPPEKALSYGVSLGLFPERKNKEDYTGFPRWLARRISWKQLSVDVGEVYKMINLPSSKISVVGANYGIAGSLERYRDLNGLSNIYGRHNSYYYWKKPAEETEEYLMVGFKKEELQEHFSELIVAEPSYCDLCTEQRRYTSIIIARGANKPVGELWSALRLIW